MTLQNPCCRTPPSPEESIDNEHPLTPRSRLGLHFQRPTIKQHATLPFGVAALEDGKGSCNVQDLKVKKIKLQAKIQLLLSCSQLILVSLGSLKYRNHGTNILYADQLQLRCLDLDIDTAAIRKLYAPECVKNI